MASPEKNAPTPPDNSGEDKETAPVDMDVTAEGALVRVRLRNAISVSNLFSIKKSIYRILKDRHPSTMELDLSAVEELDSSAIGMFLEIQRSLTQMDGELFIVSPTDRVRSALNVMGLQNTFTIKS